MKILRATGIFCKKYVCKYVNNYKIFWNFIKVSFFLIITFLKKFYRSSIKRLSLLISPKKKNRVFRQLLPFETICNIFTMRSCDRVHRCKPSELSYTSFFVSRTLGSNENNPRSESEQRSPSSPDQRNGEKFTVTSVSDLKLTNLYRGQSKWTERWKHTFP